MYFDGTLRSLTLSYSVCMKVPNFPYNFLIIQEVCYFFGCHAMTTYVLYVPIGLASHVHVHVCAFIITSRIPINVHSSSAQAEAETS